MRASVRSELKGCTEQTAERAYPYDAGEIGFVTRADYRTCLLGRPVGLGEYARIRQIGIEGLYRADRRAGLPIRRRRNRICHKGRLSNVLARPTSRSR